jgi:hypothetical protein
MLGGAKRLAPDKKRPRSRNRGPRKVRGCRRGDALRRLTIPCPRSPRRGLVPRRAQGGRCPPDAQKNPMASGQQPGTLGSGRCGAAAHTDQLLQRIQNVLTRNQHRGRRPSSSPGPIRLGRCLAETTTVVHVARRERASDRWATPSSSARTLINLCHGLAALALPRSCRRKRSSPRSMRHPTKIATWSSDHPSMIGCPQTTPA